MNLDDYVSKERIRLRNKANKLGVQIDHMGCEIAFLEQHKLKNGTNKVYLGTDEYWPKMKERYAYAFEQIEYVIESKHRNKVFVCGYTKDYWSCSKCDEEMYMLKSTSNTNYTNKEGEE